MALGNRGRWGGEADGEFDSVCVVWSGACVFSPVATSEETEAHGPPCQAAAWTVGEKRATGLASSFPAGLNARLPPAVSWGASLRTQRKEGADSAVPTASFDLLLLQSVSSPGRPPPRPPTQLPSTETARQLRPRGNGAVRAFEKTAVCLSRAVLLPPALGEKNHPRTFASRPPGLSHLRFTPRL